MQIRPITSVNYKNQNVNFSASASAYDLYRAVFIYAPGGRPKAEIIRELGDKKTPEAVALLRKLEFEAHRDYLPAVKRALNVATTPHHA